MFDQVSSPSLDSVKFDDTRYSYQGEKGEARVWFLPEGGGLGLYFFPGSPDLPLNARIVAELRKSYAADLKELMTVVDCRVMAVDGVQSIWLVIKVLNKEIRGATYIGSLTIPFRDFSFVIKIQCQEQGITGIRETALMISAQLEGTVTVEQDKVVFHGWSPDDEEFDAKFPQHPLSRVRAELRQLTASVTIAPAIKSQPRFELPPSDA